MTGQTPTQHLARYPDNLKVVAAHPGVTQDHWDPGSWDRQKGDWLLVVPQSDKGNRNRLVGDLGNDPAIQGCSSEWRWQGL